MDLQDEDGIEEQRAGQQHQQAELERYRRLIRCMCILMAFWFIMLYFIAHRDDGLVIAGVVIMGIWIIYMCMCICGNLFLRFRDEQRIPMEDEECGLTSKAEGSLFSDDATAESSTHGFSYPLDKSTLDMLKKCSEVVSPTKSPTNGTYAAVLSSIFMGKAIRTEGKLRLEFLQTRDNGWAVEGESIFGTKKLPIEDGFVNAIGEMYWRTGPTIHRGILDFSSSTMFDGEFVLIDAPFAAIDNQKPVGRIVRLELATASFYSTSVEMVTISPNTTNGAEAENDEVGLFV